ncbi:mechanosensitive ion channel family protein [Fundidesulfovibrio terrae]|uniref:mechanosensitive ion channel family protein n=1 Tax=Fundidesulfovibrio terrae TaxID=2922866 RepID=UPI001FAF9628|nr:mechanosensitive ion channel family protein [Fundidesulfovibrio terrae]
MTTPVADLVNALEAAKPSDLVIIAALAGLAVCLQALQARLKGKGALGPVALAKWLTVLAALRVLDIRVLKDALATPSLVLHGLVIWMALRTILHDIYADLYLTRLKNLPVNKILLNLCSFAAALALAGYGLRQALNVDVGSILTSSAIITAVVGFSMQDTIGSLFSGLLIQTEKPFKIGDWIKVGDIEGQVDEITWRYTKLTTFSSDQVLIPNNAIVKDRLVNKSEPIRQVSVSVPVPAPLGTPPVKVKSALEDVLRRAPLVAPRPEPRVRLHEIGQDQITYRLSFSVEDFEDTVAAKSDVLSAVWYEFRKQGIDFPVSRQMLLPGRSKGPCAVSLDVANLVKGVGLFSGMHADELDLLVQCAAVRTFPPEARIVERGQGGTTMFVIASGLVSVRIGEKELSRLGPGDVFGEMALLTGEPRTADVVALEPTSCLEVDREAFRGVLDKNPALVANVTRVFKEREEKFRGAAPSAEDDSAQGLFERFRRIFW